MEIKLTVQFRFVTKEEEEAFKLELLESMKDDDKTIDLSKYLTSTKRFFCDKLQTVPTNELLAGAIKPITVFSTLKATLIQF